MADKPVIRKTHVTFSDGFAKFLLGVNTSLCSSSIPLPNQCPILPLPFSHPAPLLPLPFIFTLPYNLTILFPPLP